MKLILLDIQRMSSEDGPGLRTTAFLKGCPLACAWCHNPESISQKVEIMWYSVRCIGCKSCIGVCPQNALSAGESGIVIDREACTGCALCVKKCPGGALEAKGRECEAEALVRELAKDRAYFGDDGGVTLSGGEALMQEGSIELLRLLKQSGISTAVDTCGFVSPSRLGAALSFTDLVLYDVKLADSEQHRKFTGQPNDLILENLKLVSEWAQRGGRLWIRTPIIPDTTDSLENVRAIAALLAATPGIERWELCAFNNLCRDKYERLDKSWGFAAAKLMSREKMQSLEAAAKEICTGFTVKATGTYLD